MKRDYQPADRTAAVALRIISLKLTERGPSAFVITLIDSSPELLLFTLLSGILTNPFISFSFSVTLSFFYITTNMQCYLKLENTELGKFYNPSSLSNNWDNYKKYLETKHLKQNNENYD